MPATYRHERPAGSSKEVKRTVSQLAPSTPTNLPTTRPTTVPTATSSGPCRSKTSGSIRTPAFTKANTGTITKPTTGASACSHRSATARGPPAVASSPATTPAMVGWIPDRYVQYQRATPSTTCSGTACIPDRCATPMTTATTRAPSSQPDAR